MPTPLDVRQLLREFDLRPNKSLGQNWLVDESALARIAAAAELTPQDTVLEIGPGLGSLTRHLAEGAGRVVAVELDAALIPPLHRVWPIMPMSPSSRATSCSSARRCLSRPRLVFVSCPVQSRGQSAVLYYLGRHPAFAGSGCPPVSDCAHGSARSRAAHHGRAGQDEPAGGERAVLRAAFHRDAHQGRLVLSCAQGGQRRRPHRALQPPGGGGG